MQTLLANLEKIHTTPLGLERIRCNLHLQTQDVVLWCIDTIKQADLIIGQGKNWYVYHRGVVITIHAKSFTIITAQHLNAKVRLMREEDFVCLPEFLYQAIFIPKSCEQPPRSIIHDPRIAVYINHFGTKYGDIGVVAEQNHQVIGAAWTRIIQGHGHIDDETPELAISILPEFRGYGIGASLMNKLFVELKSNGFKRTSLSVQKDSPAIRFYERLGYKVTDEKLDHVGNEDFIMIKTLD